jgi:hypothetical protein
VTHFFEVSFGSGEAETWFSKLLQEGPFSGETRELESNSCGSVVTGVGQMEEAADSSSNFSIERLG